MGYTITFLGTAGARFMVIRQLLASGGFWMDLNGTQILVDPGPGCIVQVNKRKLRPDKLSAIIVSHRHIDHSSDVNIMVEAMTDGGFRKHGYLFAPGDAIETEPILLSYLKPTLDSIEVLKEGKSYSLDNVSFVTPVRHVHGVETYGMVFISGDHTFSYIPDTRYFDRLLESYRGELIIMNVMRLESDSRLDHLSVPDAARIINSLKPRAAILTHFGMTMWRAKPWEVAERLSQETGVRVIAARDGMTFSLDSMDTVRGRKAAD